jgi:4-hydroxythreonine-4-phosphate dehydrogenase
MVLLALARRATASTHAVWVYAAPAHVQAALHATGVRLPVSWHRSNTGDAAPGLRFVALEGPESTPTAAVYTEDWGRVARAALELTAADALAGRLDAVVTAPVCKRITAELGDSFPGQTELYATRWGAQSFAMMLAGPTLRVVPITTHVPLRDVPKLVTVERVLSVLEVTHAALVKDFGVSQPRIAVCGLNPHAGEGGLLGDEEQRVVAPAISAAQRANIDAQGPFPADTVFWQASKGAFDAVLCCYHDQGLGPLKLLHFDEAVNVTLGLRFPRTSPDHGTAYALAGTGRGSSTSTEAAIALATTMVEARRGGA